MGKRRASVSIRINSQSSSLAASRHLDRAQRQIDHSLGALASGSRVVHAGDDAAGFAIAESLRGQLGGVKQAKFNAESATSLVQTAEGGLNEQNNILVRLRELAVYAASDTVGNDERGFLNAEFTQLTEEFDRIAKSTRFGNKQVLTGSGEEFQFQVGAFKGPENVIKFTLDANTTAVDIGVEGIEIDDKSGALDALATLDEAILKISGVRSTFGAMQSRLQYTIDALSIQTENIAQARSHIQQQMAVSVITQANTSAQQAVRLLIG
jgi:flagellin